MDENLMDFSINNENIEDDFHPPALMQTPVVKNSILKPSNRDNLIQLCTPVHKGLKVKFQTPHSVKKSTPTRFEDIRVLDEEERWIERTAVVTKQDNQQNTQYAKDILIELIDNLPVTKVMPKAELETGESAMREDAFNLTELDNTVLENQNADTTLIRQHENPTQEINDNLKSIVSDKGTEIQSRAKEEEDTEDFFDAIDTQEDLKTSVEDTTLTDPPPVESDSVNIKEQNTNTDPLAEINEKSDQDASEHNQNIDKKEEVHTDVTKSPPLPSSKGSYTIDFDNLNDFNPFQSKSGLSNSPAVVSNGVHKESPESNSSEDVLSKDTEDKHGEELQTGRTSTESTNEKADKNNSSLSELQNVNDNPFLQLIESPAVKEKLSGKCFDEILGSQTDNILSQSFEDIDPFKTKSKVQMSPVAEKEVQNETRNSITDNDVLSNAVHKEAEILKVQIPGETDQFKPSSKTMNSPNNNIEPLESSRQVSVSPDTVLQQMVAKENDTLTLNPVEQRGSQIPDVSDPFKSRSQILNSPISTADPFKPSRQILNSPDAVSKEKPIESISDEDPFKSRSQIPNSPDLLQGKNKEESISDIDPFKSRSQIPNSPDVVSQSKHVEESISDRDPFKSQTQIPNSPDVSQGKHKEESVSDIDPFKSRSQIPNSPVVRNADKNLGKEISSQSGHSCESSTSTGPRESSKNGSSQLLDNSTKHSNGNVTSCDSSMQKAENINPFETKSKIVSSPVSDSADPFKTVSKIGNSPVHNSGSDGFADMDPFKASTKMMNSPAVATNDSCVKDSKTNNSSSEAVDSQAVDPFQTPKPKVNNASSNKNSVSVDQNSQPGQVEEQLQDPFKTPGRDTQPKEMMISNKQGFVDPAFIGLSEDDFKPATTDIFSDPSALDMLEQFGSGATTESSLSRMSLYVKFDPLVDLPPGDPRRASIVRRASIDPRRVSINPRRPEQFNAMRQLDPEESFLLMGTPPKKCPRNITTQSLAKEGTPTSLNAKHQKRLQEVGSNQMDLLCSNTPEAKKSEDRTQTSDTLRVKTDDTEEAGIIEVLQYTDADLKRIKQRLTMEFQGMLMVKEQEWSKENKALKDKIEKERHQMQESKKDVQNIAATLSEYEVIITSLVADGEKMKEELKKANEKKSQAEEDVQSIETSFSDLMKRYEKLKVALENCRKNEDIWKKCIEEHEATVKKTEKKVSLLKQAAEEKLTQANQQIQKLRSSTEGEIAKLQAELKRKEVQLEGCKTSLEQKSKENKELTELCDQLIAKVGS